MRTSELRPLLPPLFPVIVSLREEILLEVHALTPISEEALRLDHTDACLPSFGLGPEQCHEAPDEDEYYGDYDDEDVWYEENDDRYGERHSPLDDGYYCVRDVLESNMRAPQDAFLWPEYDTDMRPLSLEFTVREDLVPVKQDFFDEDDELVRTMSFEDVKEIDGKMTAMTMRVTPHNKEGEYTVFRFLELDFESEIDESMFSLQALKQ